MGSRTPVNKQAMVIGAGVAGLTVAHELAERGYNVVVYENTLDPKGHDRPAIGGMARTQWARVTPLRQGLKLTETDISGRMNRTLDCASLQDIQQQQYGLPRRMGSPWPELYFARASFDVDKKPRQKEKPELESPGKRLVIIARHLAGHLRKLAEWDASDSFPSLPRNAPLDTIWVRGTKSFDESYELFSTPGVPVRRPVWPEDIDTRRATALSKKLRTLLLKELGSGWTIAAVDENNPAQVISIIRSTPGLKRTIANLQRAGVGTVHDLDRVRSSWQERYAQIALEENYVAGEHGFRLFPRFYRHLRDTMRRTPILRERPRSSAEFAALRAAAPKDANVDDIDWEITSQTAHDNLVPVVEHGFASAGAEEPTRLPRFRGDSLADLFRTLDVLQKQLGWSNRDMALAQLKVAEYVTSGPARRVTYESKSWWEYLSGNNQKKFSNCFKDSLERWPQALIGLGAIDIDARTFGSTMIQQFADQLAPLGFRDGVLNGPTSTAWLDPWRIYLEHLGVQFEQGNLKRLRFVRDSEGKRYLAPFFAGEAVTTPTFDDSPNKSTDQKLNQFYLVLALPVEKTWKVARGLHQWFSGNPDALKAVNDKDYARATKLVEEDPVAAGLLLEGDQKRLGDYLRSEGRHAALDALEKGKFQHLRSLLERHDEAAELAAAAKWERFKKLVKGDEQGLREFQDSDFRKVLDMLDRKPGTLEGIYHPARLSEPDPPSQPDSPQSPSPLKKFAGVQFFFDEDFRFFPGHMYYPDSAWRLTSISQMQFRKDLAAERSTNRGLVSVVIGRWNEKGGADAKGPTAWECNDRQLAEECWRQIVECFGSDKPPSPLWYHVDRSIEMDASLKRRYNRAPYLTTTKGRFQTWPGQPGKYELSFNTVSLAGSFMQTHTRLVTMESANESARHAVNAILDDWASDPAHETYVGSRAEIWNPEDGELPNIEYLRRIDDRLFEEGLPHAFEILGLERFISDPTDDGHPLTLAGAIARVGASQGRAVSAFADALRRAMEQMGGS